jgi:hypothetical protein
MRRSFGWSLAGFLGVMPLLLGCGQQSGSAGGGWVGQIDTLADGRVLVRNDEGAIWPEGVGWQVVEEVRIGTVDGEGPESFGDIRSFAVDDRGRFWVLDGQASELRVFDRDGGYLRTVGRAGSGPGEFRYPVHVDLSPAGQIWVMDPGNARISVFDTAGSYIESIRAPRASTVLPWPGGCAGNGIYHSPLVRFRPTFRMELVRHDRAFAPLDTIPVPGDPIERQEFSIVVDGRVVEDEPVPFQGTLAWRLSGSGTLWALLTDQYRLFEISPDGDTLRVVTKSFSAVPVSDEERAEALEDLRPFMERGGKVDHSRIPRHKPAVSSFFLGADGHIWVVKVEPDQMGRQAFDVFDPTGRYLGAVVVPFQLRRYPSPFVRDGLLYGVIRDELDVEHVVRARVKAVGV